jgi:hypothetical protein
MLLRARSAKTERKTENKTECLCPLQRSVLELRRQMGPITHMNAVTCKSKPCCVTPLRYSTMRMRMCIRLKTVGSLARPLQPALNIFYRCG